MQIKVLITLVAALAVATVLATVAMPAASQDTTSAMDMSAADMSNMAAMAMPKAVLMTISVNNMTDGNVAFSVPYAARVQQVGNKDIAIVATYNKPLTGMANASTGMGTIAMSDALPATATIDYTNRTSIHVSGSNAVVALQDFKMTGAGRGQGNMNFQFGSITAYLPDGTARSMKLDRPIRMSANLDTLKLTIDANPAAAGMIGNMLKSGATFPSGATPVRLNDILAA
ncbi:MAG TPA: hypothetical protein VGJ92_03515 [Methanocella sp.]|jgi:hypothetical protein